MKNEGEKPRNTKLGTERSKMVIFGFIAEWGLAPEAKVWPPNCRRATTHVLSMVLVYNVF